jgi:hypothetical protein
MTMVTGVRSERRGEGEGYQDLPVSLGTSFGDGLKESATRALGMT